MLLIKKLTPISMFRDRRVQITGFVGVGKIRFEFQWRDEQLLLRSIQKLESEGLHIQIFNSDKILSPKHLYYAVYFAEQAFALSSNISKKKSIEYLIYASFQRQIKNAIDSVGFTFDGSNHPNKAYIVITAHLKKMVMQKYTELLETLHASSVNEELPPLKLERMRYFQDTFQISDFELKNSLHCLGLPVASDYSDQEESIKLHALLNIFIEKMAQLLMENFKQAN